MKIPFSYTLRNLWTRKLTTLLTAGGMALVVFVFATVLMLEEGLRKTLVDTGSYDNVIVIRRSAQTEVQSAIDRAQASLIESQPEVALDADGERMVSKETIVLVNLNKRDSDKPTNVMVRGVGPRSLTLRPQVKIIAGRMSFGTGVRTSGGMSVGPLHELHPNYQCVHGVICLSPAPPPPTPPTAPFALALHVIMIPLPLSPSRGCGRTFPT